MKIVTHCQLKNSHNLEIESYFVFGGNSQDFKPRRQHLK